MATPRDRDPARQEAAQQPGRMGEGYFILGMAVQVGLVGLVGLALVGVQGFGFLTLGTAVALAGLAIGILAIGSILTLASLRHTLNVVNDHGQRIDGLAERLGAMAEELRVGDEAVGWEDLDIAAQGPRRGGPDNPHERRPEPRPDSPPDPLEEGGSRALIDVPGIDAERTETLSEMGITDTRELWEQNATYLAGRLEEEPGEVKRWQTAAELMAVDGIDAESADRLARAGVRSVNELEHESPERLMRRIEQAQAEGEVDATVGPQQAHRWIEAAREHTSAPGASPSETGGT